MKLPSETDVTTSGPPWTGAATSCDWMPKRPGIPAAFVVMAVSCEYQTCFTLFENPGSPSQRIATSEPTTGAMSVSTSSPDGSHGDGRAANVRPSSVDATSVSTGASRGDAATYTSCPSVLI